jgi:hypothetical protein
MDAVDATETTPAQPAYDYILLEAGDEYQLTVGANGMYAYGDLFITKDGGIRFQQDDSFVTFYGNGNAVAGDGNTSTTYDLSNATATMSNGTKVYFERITDTLLYAADGNYYLNDGGTPIKLTAKVNGNVTSYSYKNHTYVIETVNGNAITYEITNYAKVTVTDGVAGVVEALGTVTEKVKFTDTTSTADITMNNVAVANGLSFITEEARKNLSVTLAGDTALEKLVAAHLNIVSANKQHGIYSTDGANIYDMDVSGDLSVDAKAFGTAEDLLETAVSGIVTIVTIDGAFMNQQTGNVNIQ